MWELRARGPVKCVAYAYRLRAVCAARMERLWRAAEQREAVEQSASKRSTQTRADAAANAKRRIEITGRSLVVLI